MNDELPCLDLLEATPTILRGLMSEISDEDARWKPASLSKATGQATAPGKIPGASLFAAKRTTDETIRCR